LRNARVGAGASTSTQTANGIDGRTIDAQGRPVPFVFLTLLQEDRTGKPRRCRA
jgi:hypothetical protein